MDPSCKLLVRSSLRTFTYHCYIHQLHSARAVISIISHTCEFNCFPGDVSKLTSPELSFSPVKCQ